MGGRGAGPPQQAPSSAKHAQQAPAWWGLAAAAAFGAVLAAACCLWPPVHSQPVPLAEQPVPAAAGGTGATEASWAGATFPVLEAAGVPAVPLARDLGYMEPEQLAQIEALTEVEQELATLPVSCAVCRLAVLEAFGAAVSLGLSSQGRKLESTEHAAAALRPTLRAICSRLRRLQLFGVMGRRAAVLGSTCKAVLAEPGRRDELAALAADLALLASRAGGPARHGEAGAAVPAAAGRVDAVCEAACPKGGGGAAAALPGWPGLVEAILGPCTERLLHRLRRAPVPPRHPSPDIDTTDAVGCGRAGAAAHGSAERAARQPGRPSDLLRSGQI